MTGVPVLVQDSSGNYIEGQFAGGTNADVGYYVADGAESSPGDLLYMEHTGETLPIVDWFQSFSGVELDPQSSTYGPDIAYDADAGVMAIVSGSHAFLVKINQPPVAVDDSYEAEENVPLVVEAPGVLENDVDDSATLQAVLVEPPTHGTLELGSDGSFVYTPNLNFNREDSFQYRASDGELASQVATVAITVNTSRPWHNGAKPLDVSDDGYISPIDVLLGIDSINLEGARVLPLQRDRPLSDPFYDTSRDGSLSPIDVLLVINYLNSVKPVVKAKERRPTTVCCQTPWPLPMCHAVFVPAVQAGGEIVTASTAVSPAVAMPQSVLPQYEIGFEPLICPSGFRSLARVERSFAGVRASNRCSMIWSKT